MQLKLICIILVNLVATSNNACAKTEKERLTRNFIGIFTFIRSARVAQPVKRAVIWSESEKEQQQLNEICM